MVKTSRRTQILILRVLNQYLPPALRDARWFGKGLLRLAFGRGAELVSDFKESVWAMSDEEIIDVNRRLSTFLPTETDLNAACFDRVVERTLGDTVLEVGCGRGLLAEALARQFSVTACDLVLDATVVSRLPQIRFETANAERLPFPTQSFDTVVSTHTLEHTLDLHAAIAELRRVARRRLILVVPCERPYRYTFNLHLHFFPYPHSLRAAINSPADAICQLLDGDLYYEESLESRVS